MSDFLLNDFEEEPNDPLPSPSPIIDLSQDLDYLADSGDSVTQPLNAPEVHISSSSSNPGHVVDSSPSESTPSRMRHFVFTWNNPTITATDFAAHLASVTRYYCFQLEQGEENGTLHFQGYLEFDAQKTFSAAHKALKYPLWLRMRRGTREEARDYAQKEDTRIAGPWIGGRWVEEQTSFGRQTRDQIAADIVVRMKAGTRFSTLVDLYPSYVISNFTHLSFLYQQYPPPIEKPWVSLLMGPTGTGKTNFVYQFAISQGLSVGKVHLPWFNGYIDQDILLIDDFNKKICLEDLLAVLDRYPQLLNVKNGFFWRRAKEIVITSNIHPKHWYDYEHREENYRALVRRIDVVFQFSYDVEEPVILNKVDFF